jgi:glycine/D-amino acid oxidase-like deaminating enzyme
MTSETFTADFKQTPYWWDRTPRPDIGNPQLPGAADIVIIGSGYTGLCAALETTRAGWHTVIIDVEDAGWGCSARNGGLVSTSIKPGFEALASKHGEKATFNILSEGHSALAWIGDFVKSEKLECSFDVCGKFYGAHTPAQFEKLVANFPKQHKGLEVSGHVVPRAEQHTEIATDAYYGGIVYARHASIDPARYHQGLLDRAIAGVARIIPNCRAQNIDKDGDGFLVTTAKGKIKARQVLVATNGYTDTVFPWARRRVIPIGSYMIATEPLPKALMDRLMPKGRTFGDTRKVVYYYRPSPDRTRIIFGGRVTGGETDPVKSAPLLRRDLIALFPELAPYKVSHTWMGIVAYTFDHLPHVGEYNGIHYAMGYCGSGVSMASYLGTRAGQQLLGKAESRTAFDGIGFQTRPLYTGKPWFLPASVAYYRWRDQMKI